MTNLLVSKNKSQFRFLDDFDGDTWKDYKLHGEKVTLYDDKFFLRTLV